MLTPDHVKKAFENIERKAPQFLINNWVVLYSLFWELHSWMDQFANIAPYDNVYTLYYHREQRHHWEGIDEAILIFTSRYGIQLMPLIRQELEMHIFDDFGEIPSKSECSRRYLREKRGW